MTTDIDKKSFLGNLCSMMFEEINKYMKQFVFIDYAFLYSQVNYDSVFIIFFLWFQPQLTLKPKI